MAIHLGQYSGCPGIEGMRGEKWRRGWSMLVNRRRLFGKSVWLEEALAIWAHLGVGVSYEVYE